jgi:hypothetical protein
VLSYENGKNMHLYNTQNSLSVTYMFNGRVLSLPHYQNVFSQLVSIINTRKSENLKLLLGVLVNSAFLPLDGRLNRETVGTLTRKDNRFRLMYKKLP